MSINWILAGLAIINACSLAARAPKNEGLLEKAPEALEEKWSGPRSQDYLSQIKSLDTVEYPVDKANKLYTLTLENFMSVGKEDPRTPQLLLWRADAFFKEGLLANAINYYDRLIKDYPNSIHAEKAGKNIAIAYAKLGEYGKADDWQKNNVVKPDGEKEQLKRAREKYLEAERYRQEKEYLKAASKYTQVFVEYPSLQFGEFAIFQAGGMFIELEDWNNAIKSYQKFQEKYYDSPKLPEALYREAQCWGKLRAHDRATKKYLNIVRSFPNSKYAEQSLLHVAQHFEKSGQLRLSLRVVERYSEIFPHSNRFCEFFQNGDGIGKYEKLGDDFNKINHHYQKNCQ